MKVKVAGAIGVQLDWMVARAEGKDDDCEVQGGNVWYGRVTSGFVVWQPTFIWSQGGPIIEREGIEVTMGNPLIFPKGNEKGEYTEPLWIAGKMHGQTLLIAAMRKFVESKLGDEVEVPETLA